MLMVLYLLVTLWLVRSVHTTNSITYHNSHEFILISTHKLKRKTILTLAMISSRMFEISATDTLLIKVRSLNKDFLMNCYYCCIVIVIVVVLLQLLLLYCYSYWLLYCYTQLLNCYSYCCCIVIRSYCIVIVTVVVLLYVVIVLLQLLLLYCYTQLLYCYSYCCCIAIVTVFVLFKFKLVCGVDNKVPQLHATQSKPLDWAQANQKL